MSSAMKRELFIIEAPRNEVKEGREAVVAQFEL
jgi:hypothetical protein